MPETTQDLHLSEALKRVIKIAQALAKENMQPEFAPAHLLKALLHKEAGLLPLLKTLDQDVYYLEEWAEVRTESLQKKSGFSEVIPGNALISEVIHEADNIRLNLSQDEIEPVHI